MSPHPLEALPGPAGPPRVPGHELGELLGRGAVGAVWAATRTVDGRRVAVKIVPVDGPAQADALAREVAVLGRVEVDGLVGFHEAICLDTEPPSVALVLDHLGGGSLERAVRARGRLSVGESVTVLVPVARALAGLHALGVAHGDVTPANVLLALSGRPFVADLGVARLAGAVPGCLWGTPGFVAPEVLAEGVLTAAADVYAVGALAWWCVTGAVPGPGPLRRPLDEVVPGLPPAWSEVTTQALLGDPALRPTAAELALAYYDSTPCEPLRMVVGTDETSLLTQRLRRPTTPADPVPTRGRTLRRPPHARAGALATLVALVSVLGVGGLAATGALRAPAWLRGETPRVSTTPVVAVSSPPTSGTSANPSPADLPGRAPALDPARDRQAAHRNPLGLVVALSALRSEAMNTRSAEVLAELDLPGSPALARDTALLRDLGTTGTSWQDVRFEVSEARAVAVRGEAATVEAVVGTAAHRVVGPTGVATTRAAERGRLVRFELVWSGGRWRVDRVVGVGEAVD